MAFVMAVCMAFSLLPVNAAASAVDTSSGIAGSNGRANPTMEDTNIYANGVSLILTSGSGITTKTAIYIDKNSNGVIDVGEDTIWDPDGAGNTFDGTMAGNDLSGCDIYGGSKNAAVTSTKITMTGGEVCDIYGGGHVERGGSANVYGSTSITVSGGRVIKYLCGGGYSAADSAANVTGSTRVEISGGKAYEVYGGGYADWFGTANVAGNTSVEISGGEMDGIYGGACSIFGTGNVAGNTSVKISGGKAYEVYGGGYSAWAGTADVAKVSIAVSGGEVIDVYGGGNGATREAAANVSDVSIIINGGRAEHVYGVGLDETSNSTPVSSVSIQISGMGLVTSQVFGGYVAFNSDQNIGRIGIEISGRSKVAEVIGGNPVSAAVIEIGGGATVGDACGGIRINGLDGAPSGGVDSFVIGDALTGSVGCIRVFLTEGYDASGNPVIATDAVAADLPKITLAGSGAGGKQLYLDGTDIKVREVHAISGTVIGSDTSGGGIAATLQLKKDGVNLGPPVTADENGRYTIPNVPAGTYNIEVSCADYDSGLIEDLTVQNGDVAGNDLTLTRTAAFVPVTGITMKNPALVDLDAQLVLAAEVTPASVTNRTIVWSVAEANGTGATIMEGSIFYAVTAGAVTVKATIENGASAGVPYTKDFTIIITPKYTINASAGGGGSISPSGSVKVGHGKDQGFTIAPNSGYSIASVTVDGVNKGALRTYTFRDVTEDHVISALFQKNSGGKGSGKGSDAGSGKAVGSMTVNLSKDAQEKLIAEQPSSFVVVLDRPDIVLSLDLAAVREIYRQADGDVQITVTRMTDTFDLSDEGKEVIGGRPLFELRMTCAKGTRIISSFGSGRAAIQIPCELQGGEDARGLYLFYLDESNNLVRLPNSGYDSEVKTVRGISNHFSIYGIGYKVPTAFTDIAGHWAEEDIAFIVNRGLMSGTSTTTFSPDVEMTRGMFVTALGKLAGVTAADNSPLQAAPSVTEGGIHQAGRFSDVKADAYYSSYVNWAVEKDVAKGTSAMAFSPDKIVTRQEMAVFMANYARAMGYPLPKSREADAFADSANIESWAEDAVKTMRMAGILNGKNGNLFDPQGSATRAEISTVLRHYVELVTDPAAQDLT